MTHCCNCSRIIQNPKKKSCNYCLEKSRIWGFNKKHKDKDIQIVLMDGLVGSTTAPKYVVVYQQKIMEYKGTRILFYIDNVWKGNFLDRIPNICPK